MTSIEKPDQNFRLVTKDGLEFKEFIRISEWSAKHSPNCIVCNHKDVGEIENMYMDWATNESLGMKYGIDSQAIKRHFEITGLRKRRIGDRRNFWESIIESYRASGRSAGLDEAMRAAEHLDKLDGKLVERREVVTKDVKERDAEYEKIIDLVRPESSKSTTVQ